MAVVTDDIKGLGSKIDQITNDASRGAGGIVGETHLNERLPGMSFFEEDITPRPMAKAMYGRPMYRNQKVTLPKSYVPAEFRNFGDFVRKGMKDSEAFAKAYVPAFKSLAKALDLNTAAFEEGGALVLPEFAPEIMAMLYEGESLWARTRQYTVSGNSMKFPKLRDTNRTDGNRHGGVLGYWLGEGDTATESNTNFDEMDISLQKLCVAVFLTEEMLSDSGYAIEQFVTEVVQAEIDYQLDKALIRGNGVKKPLGILNSASRVTVLEESGQASNTLLAANIDKMWQRRLAAGAGDDLIWIYNQDCEQALSGLYYSTGANSGQLVFNPPGGISERPYATIKGRPAIPSEHASTLGDEGDIILANLRDYIGINKGQVNQLASPHVQFLQQKLCLLFTFRVNGRPCYDTPVTMEQSAETRSAFVTIETR